MNVLFNIGDVGIDVLKLMSAENSQLSTKTYKSANFSQLSTKTYKNLL